MQKIIKTFFWLAAIFIMGGIYFHMVAVEQSSYHTDTSPSLFVQLGQGLFMLSAVLVICATALLYKYGWGTAKQDAGK
jgi:hypothetical protein